MNKFVCVLCLALVIVERNMFTCIPLWCRHCHRTTLFYSERDYIIITLLGTSKYLNCGVSEWVCVHGKRWCGWFLCEWECMQDNTHRLAGWSTAKMQSHEMSSKINYSKFFRNKMNKWERKKERIHFIHAAFGPHLHCLSNVGFCKTTSFLSLFHSLSRVHLLLLVLVV